MSTQNSIVITGASSGIGLAIAEKFSSHGFHTFLIARSKEKLQNVQKELLSSSTIIPCDLSDSKSIAQAAEVIQHSGKSIGCLVNNAGIYQMDNSLTGGMSPWTSQFQTNLFGAVEITQKLLPALLKNKGSSVVNVSSTLALKGNAHTAAYCASKAAMNSWTQSLALEFGSQGLRVNCVCPGLVDTPIHSFHSLPSAEKAKTLESMSTLQPLGRIGKPEDIAHAVYFLASPESAWTTGAILSVDGGINLV